MPAPAPSKKSVSDIKSLLLRPALTSHFECTFDPPKAVRNWISSFRVGAGLGIAYDSNIDLFSLSCSEASLPGSSLMTNEIIDDYTGVTERHAYRRQYDDRSDFTFYVDHDYNIIFLFENWMSYITNEQFKTSTTNNVGIEYRNYSYRMNYPENSDGGYKTEIYIKKFEKDFQGRVLQYRFINAYPISITSMPVSYDSSQLLKCTVSFTYSRYVIGGGGIISSPSVDSEPSSPRSIETPPPSQIFDTSRMTTTVTNEYYNNFGQNPQDATNTANFFGAA